MKISLPEYIVGKLYNIENNTIAPCVPKVIHE